MQATFQFDRIGPKLIEEMGVETLMWGSDYPHPDGVWPESSKYIEEQFAGLPAEIDPQDHLRERRQVLRPDELNQAAGSEGLPAPSPGLASLATLSQGRGALRRNTMAYDLLIKNGRIVDGSGGRPSAAMSGSRTARSPRSAN